MKIYYETYLGIGKSFKKKEFQEIKNKLEHFYYQKNKFAHDSESELKHFYSSVYNLVWNISSIQDEVTIIFKIKDKYDLLSQERIAIYTEANFNLSFKITDLNNQFIDFTIFELLGLNLSELEYKILMINTH